MPGKRTPKPAKPRKTGTRNPLARSLASPLFRNKTEPKPGTYKRRPKHPKPVEIEE